MDIQEICGNYLERILQHFGMPSSFITMPRNPSCPEIVSNIDVGESANFRIDIVVRELKSKLKAIIERLALKNIFGKAEVFIELRVKR